MAKMGDRIAKVVCKRCGGHHRYRNEDATGADTEGSEGRRPMSSARRTSRPRAQRTPAPLPVPPFDPSKPARSYSPRDSYGAGERVSHPSFGVGVVAGSPGAGKVEVVFPGGSTRVLACAKAESTLARPVAALDLPISDRPPK